MSKPLVPGHNKPALQEDGDLDFGNTRASNLRGIDFESAQEVTISNGAITIDHGHIKVLNESGAANDDLDTINGGESGEVLFILPSNDAQTVRIRNGVGNIYTKHQVDRADYSFNSPTGSSGIDYVGGNYLFPATEAALTNGSPTVTVGSANASYAMHAVVVGKGDGATDGSDLVLTVTGASIDDEGNYNGSDSQVIVADALLATFALNTMSETPKKWLGQATITLSSTSGGTFNCSFNYGYAKYEDFGNQDFTSSLFEVVGVGGANDTGANFRLLKHSTANWHWHATAFVPGPTAGEANELTNMNTDHSTEQNLINGEPFQHKRVDLNTDISGSGSEGTVVEITTSANRAIEHADLHFGVHTAPAFTYMASTKQHLIFMKHGGNWLEL